MSEFLDCFSTISNDKESKTKKNKISNVNYGMKVLKNPFTLLFMIFIFISIQINSAISTVVGIINQSLSRSDGRDSIGNLKVLMVYHWGNFGSIYLEQLLQIRETLSRLIEQSPKIQMSQDNHEPLGKKKKKKKKKNPHTHTFLLPLKLIF